MLITRNGWRISFGKCKTEKWNYISFQNSVENIYSLCGVDENGKDTIILTYYNDNDSLAAVNGKADEKILNKN